MMNIDANKFWSPAFDNMSSFVCFIDCDYNLIKANESFLYFFGGGEKTLIGKKCFEIFHCSKEPFPGCPHGKMLETFVSEKEEIYDPSLKKHLSVTVTPVWGDDHKLIGSIHIAEDVSDITERKRAEDALRASQKQYAELVDSLNDWVWEIDTHGRYTYASPRVKDFLGYAPEKIVGKTPFDLMPAKEARRVAEIFKQLATEQKPIVTLENINRHKDGHLVVLETNGHPFYDEAGNFKGYRGTDRDITERKKTAKLVTFYKEYAENIVGNLPISLVVTNRDLMINFANHHFLSRMRMTKEEVTEKPLAQVMGASLVAGIGLDKKIMRVIKGKEVHIEGRFVLRNKTYDFMIVPLKEQTGRRMNALLVMEDITKNVALEEQLLHAEKLSAVGTFTASIAHEINNPLSIVVGNIQYLLSNIPQMNLLDKKEIDSLMETLITANAEAKRCAGIVTNLLHFSHRGRPEKTKLSVNSVVTGTLRLLAHQLELSNIKTTLKLADNLPFVMGNADRLQQAFVNLILNAQQVMKEGGKLYVTTALAGQDVTVSFRDTGPGIPKKYLRKIFEPFYSTKEAGKGTGLGLFIIHSIMEDHRGKIEVQSKKGGGATFIIKLPTVK